MPRTRKVKLDPADLDQTVCNEVWTREHAVYCPISWCEGNKHRHTPCGDGLGNFVGVHVARIRYVKRFQAIERRRVEKLREMGVEHPEQASAFMRIHQDNVDGFNVPGRKGRRKLAV